MDFLSISLLTVSIIFVLLFLFLSFKIIVILYEEFRSFIRFKTSHDFSPIILLLLCIICIVMIVALNMHFFF